MPLINPTSGSCIAYIQNHTFPGNIKKVIVSVIAPKKNPKIGPNIHPNTIIGIHAKEIVLFTTGKLTWIIPNVILNASRIPINAINFTSENIFHLCKGIKKFKNALLWFNGLSIFH